MSSPFSIPVAAGTRLYVPKPYERLYDLAYNMWWAWEPYARELWQRVSPVDWRRSPKSLDHASDGQPRDLGCTGQQRFLR